MPRTTVLWHWLLFLTTTIPVLVAAIPIDDSNPTLSLNPLRLNDTLINLPRLPGFEMDFTFDQSKRLRPFEVYQTAIQLMYETVQRGWDEPVHVMVAEQIEGYDVLMLFLNHQVSTAPDQLTVGHCVAALYRSIVVMTDGVIFCQLRCHLSIFEKRIGALSIAPVKDSLGVDGGNSTATSNWNLTSTDVATTTHLGADSGTVQDSENPRFTITYHFLGKTITPKEVSMVILEAMAMAAPYTKNAECKGLEVVSTDGGAAIIIESVFADRLPFTYGWATRALRILYQHIVVPKKRWGDVWLEIKYKNVKIGEMRMLRITGDTENGTNALKEER